MGGTSSGMQDPLEAGQFDPSLYDYKLIQALEQQAIPPVQSLPVGAVNTVATSNEEATHSTVLQDPLEAGQFDPIRLQVDSSIGTTGHTSCTKSSRGRCERSSHIQRGGHSQYCTVPFVSSCIPCACRLRLG